MKKPWWTWADLLASLNCQIRRRGQPPHCKSQRRMTLERLEVRQYLSGVVGVQPASIVAGQAGCFAVTMEGQIASPATVDYSVTDGTAVQGDDYLIPPGQTLTFLPDQTFPDTVSVFANADPAAVADKSFTVTLVNPVGDITLDSSQAIITLVEPASAVVGPGSPDPAVDPSTPPAPDASSSSLGGIHP